MDKALARKCDNYTLWINGPVEWMSFLIDTSSKAKDEDEDLKKELQTIHSQFLHVGPLKCFRESASAKEENFTPFCILTNCHGACADS
jgi:hypothetical protein